MEELYHYGILGQKHGRRRFQYKDGSLTPEGKLRYSSKKHTSEMSDDELKENINRLKIEKEYLDLQKQVSQLNPEKVSKGKKIINSIAKDVIAPAAKDAGKRLLTDFLVKQGTKSLGIDSKKIKTEYDKLKEEVDILDLKKKKKQYEDYLKRPPKS